MSNETVPPVPLSTYERLEAASPPERTELVLQLIQGHQHGRLELPARDKYQAVLTELRLGRDDLKSRLVPGQAALPWWSPDTEGVNLRDADLRGAHLSLAKLQHADLRGANLSGAVLRGADLSGADLERANLGGADLAGASLRGAALGEADCQKALFEDARLERAVLRFANLAGATLEAADLGHADLWGARFEGAVLTRADLRGATLKETDLRGADLTQVQLQGALLEQANLSRACLRGADFRGAILGTANLEGAVLADTRLQGADLSLCNLAGVHLAGARLERTRLQQEQFGPALGDELAGRYESARLAYLALERNFVELGDAAAASWAYRKKCRMGKLQAREQARAARRRGEWRAAISWYARYATDQAIEWSCDYGESISRPLLTLLVVYVLFTLIYGLTDGVVRVTPTPTGQVTELTRDPLDWVVFSNSAMSPTAKQPFGLQPRNAWIQLLASIQTFIGIALAGLVGFVFGNTARR
jgi:uncharacterized protein YjbI with pentapeptide repeats